MSCAGMETETNSSLPHNNDSSLTESWNVVESNDINVSEGSDGESIEVIDEEAHQTDSSLKEYGAHSSDSSRSDEDTKRASAHKERNAENTSNSSFTYNDREGSLLVEAASIGVIVVALMALSSTFSLLMLRIDTVALDIFDFFGPGRLNYNRERDRQDLINQIKFYKEESQGLKELVADLKGVVDSLKEDMINQKTVDDEKNKYNNLKFHLPRNSDDSLFQQLLNVHIEENLNYTNQEPDGSNQNSFKIVNEMLLTLKDDEKSPGYTKVIKTFYQIPKHLSVLSNFETSNQNIKRFIEMWNEKIKRANEKLITDIKQMQQKMIKHVIKNLKSTQMSFFEKLCELKDLKKQECYEVFLKPYENVRDEEIQLPNIDEGKQFYSKTVNIPDIKNNNEGSNQKKPSRQKENYKAAVEVHKNKMQEKNNAQQKNKGTLSYNGKKVDIKGHFVPGSIPEPPNAGKIHSNENKKPDIDPITYYDKGGDLGKEKGMNIDIIQDDQKDEINLFSSFSESLQEQGEETGGSPSRRKKSFQSEDVQRGLKEDNSWYLKLGSHRSKLRYLETRGEWMFDRARFRRRRNSPCCQHRTKY